MTIRHFQIFKEVCDCQGITAAADRLNISQPTVSIAIRELESFYHAKLFDRINRRIYLTEAGTLLRQYAENILEQYEEASRVLRSGQSPSKCRLGVNTSFAAAYLPELARKIKASLPECSLHITVQNNEKLETLLSDNQIDFVIYDGLNDRNSKKIEYLFREKMVLLCTHDLYPKDSIAIRELSNYPLLLREKGSGARTCVDRIFADYGLRQEVAMESTSTTSLLALAQESFGFVFVPLRLAETEYEKGSLHSVTIPDTDIYRTYYLAYNEKKHLTNIMTKFKEMISHSL